MGLRMRQLKAYKKNSKGNKKKCWDCIRRKTHFKNFI
jgi:hypothetical protein